MKALRGATSSPIKVTKTSSARAVFHLHLEQGAGGRVHRGLPELLGIHLGQALESGRLHLGVLLLEAVELGVVFQVMDLGPDLHSIEGWLGDVDVPVLDQRLQWRKSR